MLNQFMKSLSYVAFDNDFDTDERAWNPEIWATETLTVLEENMVIGNLIFTDFSNEIKAFGDTVNTRIPGEFSAKRKGTNDDVTVQAATAVKVPVVLNQHVHTSFIIRDGEESRSWADLVSTYLSPAAKSLAEHIDRILLGQVYQFLDNQTEIDPDDSDSDIKDSILDARQIMNDSNVPPDGRNMIFTSASETEALKLDLFLSAERVGDDGTRLRKASIGEVLGFSSFMCQNASGIVSGTSTTGTTDAAGSTDGVHVAGDTVITMTSSSAAITTGMYVTFNKCGGVYRVLAGGAATEITLDRGLMSDLPDDSFATWYTEGAVDLTGHSGTTAYPIGYAKEINIAASGVVPQLGQLVGFADSDNDPIRTGEYSIIDVSDGSGAGDYFILLDRPLEAALEDTDVVHYGPAKQYNFCFDRGAMALVSRPLAAPRPGTGALASVASYNNLAMRIVITYLGKSQGHLVTCDMLCGVKVLNVARGAVMLR